MLSFFMIVISSINTISIDKLQLVDIAYIFVMSISLIIFVISIVIFIKTNKTIKNIQE